MRDRLQWGHHSGRESNSISCRLHIISCRVSVLGGRFLAACRRHDRRACSVFWRCAAPSPNSRAMDQPSSHCIPLHGSCVLLSASRAVQTGRPVVCIAATPACAAQSCSAFSADSPTLEPLSHRECTLVYGAGDRAQTRSAVAWRVDWVWSRRPRLISIQTGQAGWMGRGGALFPPPRPGAAYTQALRVGLPPRGLDGVSVPWARAGCTSLASRRALHVERVGRRFMAQCGMGCLVSGLSVFSHQIRGSGSGSGVRVL